MAIKFDVEDDLTYRVDISVIAFGKEAINGVNNLLDNKINYFKYEFVNEVNDYNENVVVSFLEKTDLLIVLCTDNSYEDNVYHIAELAKHNKILSINIISSIKNYMDNYDTNLYLRKNKSYNDNIWMVFKCICDLCIYRDFIGLDLWDIRPIIKNGKLAIINTGISSGERRYYNAMCNAMENMPKNKCKLLVNILCSRSECSILGISESIDCLLNNINTDVVDECYGCIDNNEYLNKDIQIIILATGLDVSDHHIYE